MKDFQSETSSNGSRNNLNSGFYFRSASGWVAVAQLCDTVMAGGSFRAIVWAVKAPLH